MDVLGRVRRWILLDGSRLSVTAALLCGTYLLVGPLGHLLLDAVSEPLGRTETFVPLVTTFLSGDFLLVSIVVSVNSLFTSRQQASLERQADRIQAVGQFRRDVESLVEEPISPAEPARFLQVVTGAILTEAQTLSADVREDADAEADVDAFTARLSRQTEALNDAVDGESGSLELVVATADYDYSRLAAGLRRLRTEYGDVFTDDESDRIERMLALFRHFVSAREYFKTLYLTREFAALSTRLLALTLPVILVASFVLLHDGMIPNGHDVTTVVVVLALSPFFLLAAYTVRVATVATRTRAAGQFVVEDPATDDGPLP
jgi:hypothetical protein